MGKTGKDLVNHWDWAASKGDMNANSANALKTACTRVLEVDKGWETLDITSLDVESLLKRFRNLKAKAYTPDSLREYERRFRKAYSSYMAYVQDPTSWKVASRGSSPRNTKADKAQPEAAKSSSAPTPAHGLVEYPFPLREGRIVRLVLPADLKSAEVKRLTAFLATLVVDQTPADA
jgi:hypothetical protein